MNYQDGWAILRTKGMGWRQGFRKEGENHGMMGTECLHIGKDFALGGGL